MEKMEAMEEMETTVNHWQLLEALQQQNLDQTIVFSKSRMEDFRGARPALSSTVRWITVPDVPNDFVVEAYQVSNEIWIRKGHSQSNATSFGTQKVNTAPASIEVKPLPIINVRIFRDPEFEKDKRIVHAALIAVEKTLPVKINFSFGSLEGNLANADWVFWFSKKEPKANDSIKMFSFQSSNESKLVSKIGRNHWTFTKRLTVENARGEDLTLQLASLILDEDEKWKAVSAQDRRTLPDGFLKTNTGDVLEAKVNFNPQALSRPIVILFLLVLLIERLLAYKRNQ